MQGDAPALLPRSQDVDLVVSAINVPMPSHLKRALKTWSREDLNVRVFQGVHTGGPRARQVCCRETFDMETGALLAREYLASSCLLSNWRGCYPTKLETDTWSRVALRDRGGGDFSCPLCPFRCFSRWAAIQGKPGAPALMWRPSTFESSNKFTAELESPSGKYAGSVIVAHFACRRPGFKTVRVAAAHLNNVVMKQRDSSRHVCQVLKFFLCHHQAHLCFLDGNQAAHKRWPPMSMLEEVFADGHWLMPESEETKPLWSRTAHAVRDHGMCSGFLVHRDLLAEATIQ